MNVADALRNGELTAALETQQRRVQDHPHDAAARLLLVELGAVAGMYGFAAEHLKRILSADAEWRKSRKHFYRVLKLLAVRRRWPKPEFLCEPPSHAAQRYKLARAVKREDTDSALRRLDRADDASPHLNGHLDGREFDALRDADDRTASVLEAFIDGAYYWVPFEDLKRITLEPAVNVLDRIVRPAMLVLRSGERLAALLPMTYAGLYDLPDEDPLALGLDTERSEEHEGIIIAHGGKLFLTSDEEVLFGELRQIDFNG